MRVHGRIRLATNEAARPYSSSSISSFSSSSSSSSSSCFIPGASAGFLVPAESASESLASAPVVGEVGAGEADAAACSTLGLRVT